MGNDGREETSPTDEGRVVMTAPNPTNDTAPAERPGLPLEAAQSELPGLERSTPLAPSKPQPDAFDWFTDEDIIVKRQPALAVYRNRANAIVIRAEGDSADEDQFVILGTDEAARTLIAALQRELQEGGQ